MIATIDLHELPAAAGNKLFLDYIAGTGKAAEFFTYSPSDLTAALQGRQQHAYPRRDAARLLAEYNARLGAPPRVMENIDALSDPETFCLITGQQAGFLGGPVYTAYKIVTTIRLAAFLEKKLRVRFIPVFWLATEDHDFDEINHTFFLKRDGEVGRSRFRWAQQGRPIADLPLSQDVKRAHSAYLDGIAPGPYLAQVKEWFAPQPDEDFVTWSARVWSQLFAEHGLVIVEPRTLRPLASRFFQFALKQVDEIQHRLQNVSQRLITAGYTPQITSEQAGQLYTFDVAGQRVRIQEPGEHLEKAAAHPERYSTDAALRPLFADAMLPVVASVLGPGETAYQAMLRPLYDLFAVPQPLLFPRKSYTIVSARQSERLLDYRASISTVLTEQLDADAVFRDLIPASELELFASAQRELAAALTPLRAYLESIDPSLNRTWAQTLANMDRSLEKLRERTFKARMSQLGFSKRDLRTLQNALLPRGRLQERVFPLPHFMNVYGKRFIQELFSAGELDNFGHHILTLEEKHA
jgi:bacillithiol biosynthesis cysteine-adding enzyme BshC